MKCEYIFLEMEEKGKKRVNNPLFFAVGDQFLFHTVKFENGG